MCAAVSDKAPGAALKGPVLTIVWAVWELKLQVCARYQSFLVMSRDSHARGGNVKICKTLWNRDDELFIRAYWYLIFKISLAFDWSQRSYIFILPSITFKVHGPVLLIVMSKGSLHHWKMLQSLQASTLCCATLEVGAEALQKHSMQMQYFCVMTEHLTAITLEGLRGICEAPSS